MEAVETGLAVAGVVEDAWAVVEEVVARWTKSFEQRRPSALAVLPNRMVEEGQRPGPAPPWSEKMVAE